VVAAASLGIPHAPGFPAWCFLAHFFTYLPFGDIAYRVNLSSAFFASTAVALLYLVLRQTGVSRSSAILTTLLGAFSYTFWKQSVFSEVYTLGFALFLWVLFSGYRFYLTHKTFWLFSGAFAAGLLLTAHYLYFLVLPPLLILLIFDQRNQTERIRLIFIGALAFALGLSIFFYLPLRSLANPLLDWGDPETLPRFLDHLKRAQFRTGDNDFGQIALPTKLALGNWKEIWFRFISQLKHVVQILLFREYTWFAGLLGIFGAYQLWRARRRWLWVSLVFIFLSGFGYAFAVNFQFEKGDQDFLPFIPALLIYLSWVAWGLEGIQKGLLRWSHSLGNSGNVFAGSLVGLVLVGSVFIGNYSRCDLSQHTHARQFGEEILSEIDQGGILFTNNDDVYFILMYLTEVEGLRQDIHLIGASRLNQNVYPQQIQKRFPDLSFPSETVTQELYTQYHNKANPRFRKKDFTIAYGEALIEANRGQFPIYWDLGSHQLSSKFELLPKDFIFEIREKGSVTNQERILAKEAHSEFLKSIEDTFLNDEQFMKNQWARKSFAMRYNNYARYGLERDDSEDKSVLKKELYERALELDPLLPEPYFNLGNHYFKMREYAQSEDYYLRAIQKKPRYPNAYLNLGNLYLAQNKFKEAEAAYLKVIKIEPRFIGSYSNLATVYSRKGQFEKAATFYQRALEIEPYSARLYYNLGVTYYRMEQFEQALAYLNKTVKEMPQFAFAWAMLGRTYAFNGNLERAIQALDQAFLLDPKLRISLNREYEQYRAGLELNQ
jgi:tetratricopeptide (TPR) repeat protein